MSEHESFSRHDLMPFLVDPEYGLYVEAYFIERLCSERQRSGRSKKPLLMMLVDMERLPENQRGDAVRAVVAGVFSSVRETDLKGWYKNGSIVGVLFTEICDIDDSVRQKIYTRLGDKLNWDKANRIKISFAAFPEDPPGDGDSSGREQRDQKEAPADNRIFYPDLTRPKLSKSVYLVTKRVMDIAGSLVCLTFFSPLFVAIAILVKLSSPGPIIFRQERIGLYGRRFIFLKFRTMYRNNDCTVHRQYVHNLIAGQKNGNGSRGAVSNGNGVYKIINDARVTWIGIFLRKTSLDEFPQFINVLKGDMSLVGPRPPIPYEVEKYEVWHKRRIFEVRPGLSGLWQVKGRSRTTFDEMVRLDLQYLKQQSLWLDLKIVLQTPWAIVRARGAH